jgi:hypothetical protein
MQVRRVPNGLAQDADVALTMVSDVVVRNVGSVRD